MCWSCDAGRSCWLYDGSGPGNARAALAQRSAISCDTSSVQEYAGYPGYPRHPPPPACIGCSLLECAAGRPVAKGHCRKGIRPTGRWPAAPPPPPASCRSPKGSQPYAAARRLPRQSASAAAPPHPPPPAGSKGVCRGRLSREGAEGPACYSRQPGGKRAAGRQWLPTSSRPGSHDHSTPTARPPTCCDRPRSPVRYSKKGCRRPSTQ